MDHILAHIQAGVVTSIYISVDNRYCLTIGWPDLTTDPTFDMLLKKHGIKKVPSPLRSLHVVQLLYVAALLAQVHLQHELVLASVHITQSLGYVVRENYNQGIYRTPLENLAQLTKTIENRLRKNL